LPALLVEASKDGGNCYAALYERHYKELRTASATSDCI
jgi:hypothetical protein